MLLYHAADLIWATKIKSTAEAVGLQARPVRNPQMLKDRLSEGPVAALLIDLESPEIGLDLIRQVRELAPNPRPRVLAFGPHVAKDLFQAARDAGSDEVMPRGAFDHGLPEILLRLEAAARP